MLREPWQRGLVTAAAVLGAVALLSCGMARATAQVGPDAAPPAAEGTPVAEPQSTPARPEQSAAHAGAVTVVEGTLSEYSISLSQVTAPTGTVRFAVQNIGQRRHDLRVVGNGVDKQTPELRPGQSGQVEGTFDEPGIFTVYCDLGDHADRGMTTTFTVEDGTAFTHS